MTATHATITQPRPTATPTAEERRIEELESSLADARAYIDHLETRLARRRAN